MIYGGVDFEAKKFGVKTSAVCGPHLQNSAEEDVAQTSAVCNKKTKPNARRQQQRTGARQRLGPEQWRGDRRRPEQHRSDYRIGHARSQKVEHKRRLWPAGPVVGVVVRSDEGLNNVDEFLERRGEETSRSKNAICFSLQPQSRGLDLQARFSPKCSNG
ncbi:hypothetical protein LXL04_029173 [Taraxacum kok-saghyz]